VYCKEPLLFLIYINDLPLHVSSKVQLYADDVTLYSNIYSTEDCHQLQCDLDSLAQWANKCLMFFNPTKCEITSKINPIPLTYHTNNSSIQEFTHAKYLGVAIDQHLNWNVHIKQVASKATRINGFLYRNLYLCPPEVKRNIYKAMVRSIMEYASTIWGPHTHQSIGMCTEIYYKNVL